MLHKFLQLHMNNQGTVYLNTQNLELLLRLRNQGRLRQQASILQLPAVEKGSETKVCYNPVSLQGPQQNPLSAIKVTILDTEGTSSSFQIKISPSRSPCQSSGGSIHDSLNDVNHQCQEVRSLTKRRMSCHANFQETHEKGWHMCLTCPSLQTQGFTVPPGTSGLRGTHVRRYSIDNTSSRTRV